MSVKVTIQFSEREAEAILRADGFDNGWGARKSKATRTAAFKLNAAIIRVLRDRDDKPEHRAGSNAEDCPACRHRSDIEYPFICDGEPDG